jgi:hypothetical protein
MFEKNHAEMKDFSGRCASIDSKRQHERGIAKCAEVMETEMKTNTTREVSGIYSSIAVFTE